MDNDRRTVHRHESRVDTCPQCIAELHAERYHLTDPPGGARGGKRGKIVAVHPAPVWAQVFNEETGVSRWYEVDQDTLVALLDINLRSAIG